MKSIIKIDLDAIKRWWAGLAKPKRTQVALAGAGGLATLILAATGGAGGAVDDPLAAGPMFYVGVAVKLAGILLLIAGSAVLLRRWQAGRGAGRSDRQVRLLETVRLSPKQAIHLVQAGDQQLLIGATDAGLSLLTSLKPQADALEPTAPALDFNAVFALKKSAGLHTPQAR